MTHRTFSAIARISGGHWGLSETEKPATISVKTEKTGRKIAQNRKTAENNDQNHKFVIFNPSTLDTVGFISSAYSSQLRRAVFHFLRLWGMRTFHSKQLIQQSWLLHWDPPLHSCFHRIRRLHHAIVRFTDIFTLVRFMVFVHIFAFVESKVQSNPFAKNYNWNTQRIPLIIWEWLSLIGDGLHYWNQDSTFKLNIVRFQR